METQPFGKARWITSPLVVSAEDTYRKVNQYIRFRREFQLEAQQGFKLHICACESYQLFLNGRFIGRGPAVGSKSLSFYDTYTIEPRWTAEGTNILGVLVFAPGVSTETIQGFEYDELALICSLGSGQLSIDSDEAWLCSPAPEYTGASMVSRWGFYKEFFHGQSTEPWLESTYTPDPSWTPAAIRAEAEDPSYIARLEPLEVPRLRSQSIRPRSIAAIHENLGRVCIDGGEQVPTTYRDGVVSVYGDKAGSMPAVILDFGTVTVGYPRIELESGNCIYELWYGESLDLLRLDCVHSTPDMLFESYSRRSCRYLMIKFIQQESPVRILSVRMTQELYAFTEQRHFSSEDELVDRIVDTSLHTLQVNTSYHFEDCPFREQALWVFDMRIMAQIVYYHHGDAALVKKNLRQIFALQRSDGSIPATGPKDNRCNTIDFCYHLVGTLREYICYSGDISLLKELSESLLRLDAFLDHFISPTGLVHHEGVPGWGVFLDWSDRIQKAGMSVILNALYLKYLEDLLFLSRTWLEYPGDVTSIWESKAENVRREVRERLFDSERGLFVDTCTETWKSDQLSFQGNIAALYAGFFSREEIPGAIEYLSRDDIPLPFGPSFYHLCFEALGTNGYDTQILDHIKRFYSGMLERGATTWWEVFDPNSPSWSYPHPFLGNTPTYEMDWIPVSSSHGWSGVPAYAVPRFLLGIDLGQLYTDTVLITRPSEDFLGRTRWSVPLRDGQLTLEAYWEDGTYCIDLDELPQGVELRGEGIHINDRRQER